MHFCDFAPLYQNTRTYRFTNPNPTRSRRGRSSPAFQRGQPLLLQTGKRHRPGPALPSAPPHRHDYRRPPAGEAASHRAVTHEGRPSADRRLPTTGPPQPVPSPFASAALPAAGGSRPRSASDTPRRPARSPRPRRVPPLSPPPSPSPVRGTRCRRRPPRPGPAQPAPPVRPAALPWQQRRPPSPSCSNGHRRRWPPRTKTPPGAARTFCLPAGAGAAAGTGALARRHRPVAMETSRRAAPPLCPPF